VYLSVQLCNLRLVNRPRTMNSRDFNEFAYLRPTVLAFFGICIKIYGNNITQVCIKAAIFWL